MLNFIRTFGPRVSQSSKKVTLYIVRKKRLTSRALGS